MLLSVSSWYHDIFHALLMVFYISIPLGVVSYERCCWIRWVAMPVFFFSGGAVIQCLVVPFLLQYVEAI